MRALHAAAGDPVLVYAHDTEQVVLRGPVTRSVRHPSAGRPPARIRSGQNSVGWAEDRDRALGAVERLSRRCEGRGHGRGLNARPAESPRCRRVWLESPTGIEPVCAALQTAALPFGHRDMFAVPLTIAGLLSTPSGRRRRAGAAERSVRAPGHVFENAPVLPINRPAIVGGAELVLARMLCSAIRTQTPRLRPIARAVHDLARSAGLRFRHVRHELAALSLIAIIARRLG